MTHEELTTFNGQDGRKAYVAVNGKIYDVSESPLWHNGDHQGLHQAGADLTEELSSAPHVRAVIERFPIVGYLDELESPKKKGLFGFLKKKRKQSSRGTETCVPKSTI